MAFSDLYDWISRLPHPCQWRHGVQSVRLFKILEFMAEIRGEGRVSFFIEVTSWRTIYLGEFECEYQAAMEVTTSCLFNFFIKCISHILSHIKEMGVYREGSIELPAADPIPSYADLSVTQSPNYPLLFNSAFLCVCLLVISPPGRLYPRITQEFTELISPEFLSAIGNHLEEPLMRFLGSYFSSAFTSSLHEEPFHSSYARNTGDLWKVGVYCPIVCMKTRKSQHKLCTLPHTPGKLGDALRYQQLESIIQLHHYTRVKENHIKLVVCINNVRCGVHPYEILPCGVKSDLVSTERYFPSRISLSVIPQHRPGDELSVSVGHSSANPTVHVGTETAMELSFSSSKEVKVKASSKRESSFNMKYWKFEQCAQGVNGNFTWILYDSVNGKEVACSKPPSYRFLDWNAWYKDRYRKACSPFNSDGGVVFSGDKYKRKIRWRLNKNLKGKMLKLKIEGTIWLTYWRNIYSTSFYENRFHTFSEEVDISL